MPSNGNYTIRAERWCKTCTTKTPQVSLNYRYDISPEPQVPSILIRTVTWACQWCDETEDEVKEGPIPTDRVKIIRRFLSLSDEYDLLGLNVEAKPNELVFRIRLPDFDMGETGDSVQAAGNRIHNSRRVTPITESRIQSTQRSPTET